MICWKVELELKETLFLLCVCVCVCVCVCGERALSWCQFSWPNVVDQTSSTLKCHHEILHLSINLACSSEKSLWNCYVTKSGWINSTGYMGTEPSKSHQLFCWQLTFLVPIPSLQCFLSFEPTKTSKTLWFLSLFMKIEKPKSAV